LQISNKLVFSGAFCQENSEMAILKILEISQNV